MVKASFKAVDIELQLGHFGTGNTINAKKSKIIII